MHSSKLIHIYFSLHLCMFGFAEMQSRNEGLILQSSSVNISTRFLDLSLAIKVTTWNTWQISSVTSTYFCIVFYFFYFVLLMKLAKCLETICILCLYTTLNVSSVCVNYLRLKNTELCWRKCIRIQFKILITHMDILWLMAKLASEIWKQPGGHCTVPEQCNYVLQADNGEWKVLCVVDLWKHCQYHP